tara:strand:- start:2416 stop:2724 length:309 start_codon:yes stop_codon:yes gene_type:complete
MAESDLILDQFMLPDGSFAVDIDSGNLEFATKVILEGVEHLRRHGIDEQTLWYALVINIVAQQQRRFEDEHLTKTALLDDLLNNRDNWRQAFELATILRRWR